MKLLEPKNSNKYANKLSPAPRHDICLRYQKAERPGALAEAYDISIHTIYGLLRRREIARRGNSEAHRIYQCDHTFFASLDSEAKAYWLGFLMADGGVKGTSLNLGLSIVDQGHVEKFA